MATRYRFGDSEYPHFITFAVINWIDALSRPMYKDIVINSLKHCQQEKGLIINGWIIMSNHVHLIARCKPNFQLTDTMRDLNKFTSKKIEEAIRQNVLKAKESGCFGCLKELVRKTAITNIFNFGNRITTPLNYMVTIP